MIYYISIYTLDSLYMYIPVSTRSFVLAEPVCATRPSASGQQPSHFADVAACKGNILTWLRKIVFSRKPAARLGEVIFANKVSLGGLGAERPERIKNHEIRW